MSLEACIITSSYLGGTHVSVFLGIVFRQFKLDVLQGLALGLYDHTEGEVHAVHTAGREDGEVEVHPEVLVDDEVHLVDEEGGE